jgi:hypothetical protein
LKGGDRFGAARAPLNGVWRVTRQSGKQVKGFMGKSNVVYVKVFLFFAAAVFFTVVGGFILGRL